MITLTAAGDDPARPSALSALGTLGDSTAVRLLVGAAASTRPEEQAAAREALETLHRGDVTGALAAEVGRRTAAEDREVFRAFAQRAETSAIPALLTFCRSDRPSVRGPAFQALGRVADGRDLDPLLTLLGEARDDETRGEVLGVFETLVERRGGGVGLNLDPLIRGLTEGDVPRRVAFLSVTALLVDARVRTALRAAQSDPEESVRRAAGRALAGTRDPGLLPDLLEAVRRAPDDQSRTVALEGCVRLATEEGGPLTPRQRAEVLIQAMEACSRSNDRRIVVSGLGHVPDRAALEAVERAGLDPAVRPDAEQASLRLAQALGATEFEVVEGVLNRLREGAGHPLVRSNAQQLLVRLDSGWMSSGPYRKEGRRGEELFDEPFPPEVAGAGGGSWRRVPGQTDPARAGEVDLGTMTGGDHCVLYVRTRLLAPGAPGGGPGHRNR